MHFTHSCKQVAQLLTRAYDEPLGFFDRLRLRLHLAMCDNCSNVARQLDGLKALSGDMFASDFDLGSNEPGSNRPGATG